MPPKRVTKKRRVSPRYPPNIEQFSQLATLCKKMYDLKKAKFQHELLLKQIYTVVGLEETSFDIEESPMLSNILSWQVSVRRDIENRISKRDVALKQLRSVDVLDDDALKKAALCLTGLESQIAAFEVQTERLQRIVRYDKQVDFKTHITSWIGRFFRQSRKTQELIDEMMEQIKNVYREVKL
jgi:hypothetical protein